MKKTTNPTRRLVMPNSRNSRAEAWRRLGIEDPSVLNTLPRVTRILASAKQGLPRVLLALRASADPDARAFVRKYDSVSPSDRRYRIGSNWDAIAFAAGVDPLRLLEVAVSSLCRAGENVGPIIAAASHPRITKKTVQMALTDKGHRERKMLLSATGFLPTPKDSTIIGRVQLANGPKAPKEEQNSRVLLPSMEDDLKLLHSSRLTENRLLPKGSTECCSGWARNAFVMGLILLKLDVSSAFAVRFRVNCSWLRENRESTSKLGFLCA